MKPRTIGIILEVCLIGIVLDLPLFFFDMILGASVMIILIAFLLFSIWKAWKLALTDAEAFRSLPESEKELGLKDLPPRLIVVLVAALILSLLGSFSIFSFNPLIDSLLTALAIVLVVFYFFQKRKLRKKA